MKPKNFPERIIWFQSLFIYPLYLAGLVFPVNTLIPWILLGYTIFSQIKLSYPVKAITPDRPTLKTSSELSWRSIPLVIWAWIFSMILMGITILIGLRENNYGTNEMIRSLLNWMRDWALLGIYPLVGYLLPIRSELIYRSACWISFQSLFVIPLCYGAYLMKIPGLIYTSPIERLTQNGIIFYKINLYVREVDYDGIRLALFTPWSPALGLVGCIFFIYSFQEKHVFWKWMGILGSLAMIVGSVSRGAYIFLPLTIVLSWILRNLSWIQLQLTLGTTCFIGGLSSTVLIDQFQDFFDNLKSARKSSSKVRDELERVAFDRWTNSPIFGHGKQIQGPEFLKKMPIGSHHTWIGLLFTQGIIGFMAFLVPLVWSLVTLALKVKSNPIARTAFSSLMLITLASFSDNIEKLAYLYWSIFLLMGIAYRPVRARSDELQKDS
jgi:O-Antigen ligase